MLRAVALPGEIVSAVIECGRLDKRAALDPKQIEREAVAVLTEWSREWSSHFP